MHTARGYNEVRLTWCRFGSGYDRPGDTSVVAEGERREWIRSWPNIAEVRHSRSRLSSEDVEPYTMQWQLNEPAAYRRAQKFNVRAGAKLTTDKTLAIRTIQPDSAAL